MKHESKAARFRRTWGNLAKSVLELAFEDLDPKGNDIHINVEKEKRDARQFFESRRFRPWAEAAGLNRSDVEEAYVDMLDSKEEKSI